MTKYFMQQTQLAGLEADMMLAPFFTRRYSGVIILSRFQYDTENTKCKYCTAYLKGKGCTEKKCPWLAERLEAGAVPYTVQTGDNFWSIAQKYKVSMFELAKVNGKTIFSISYTGDELKIPQQ